MTEQADPNELQALRDRIAQLEAARAQPQVVDIEGFEGLRQLSHAIETKNLDMFMLNRGIPDRAFWWIIGPIIAFGVICIIADLLIRFT